MATAPLSRAHVERTPHHRPFAWLLLAAAALAHSPTRAGEPAPPGPIMVLIDLHADPMNGPLAVQQTTYQNWLASTDWALDLTEPIGAKLSFTSVGEFMEWVLPDAANGHPLVQRLYASGGMIGTHSHNKIRINTHQWQPLPPNPSPAQVLQLWNDDVGAVDAVVAAALGVTDPPAIRAINCARGSHTPSDDGDRLQLCEDFGFTIHQQGPDEQFYAYFHHYPMNTYRPSGEWFLANDPNGPTVCSPFGPVLGKNDVHFGIAQDMRGPAVKARFLLELLNWLHDVHVSHTGRVWVAGWGSHCSDVMPGTVTRTEYPLMIDWLGQHFIGKTIGGHPAAQWASGVEAREAYYAWEAAHPGEAAFDYPLSITDWGVYPYLLPTGQYLLDARYNAAMADARSVRWHSLAADAAAGGPFTVYVAYTTDGVPTVADLSAVLGGGQIAAIDPAIGLAQVVPTSAVPVAAIGTMLIPVDKIINYPASGDSEGDRDVDAADAAVLAECLFGPGVAPAPTAPGLTSAECLHVFDFNEDGDVDLGDAASFLRQARP